MYKSIISKNLTTKLLFLLNAVIENMTDNSEIMTTISSKMNYDILLIQKLYNIIYI